MNETDRIGRRMQSIQSDLTLAKRPTRARPATELQNTAAIHDEDQESTVNALNKPAPRTSDQANLTRNISFTTPIPMREQLRQAAREHETTLTQLVLDAIEATSDQLAELVAAEQPTQPFANGNLFPQREHSARRHEEPRIATSLRVGSINLEILDALVKKHKATSRSELITAALRAYLK